MLDFKSKNLESFIFLFVGDAVANYIGLAIEPSGLDLDGFVLFS